MDNPVGKDADKAFEAYQAPLNPAPGEEGSLMQAHGRYCRSFSLTVPPLSFFALDTRTGRTEYSGKDASFIRRVKGAKPDLVELSAWAKNLQGPGILVIAQPLVETPASSFGRVSHSMGDVKLPDYGDDYERVWEALLGCRHNILIVTGDIHVSRLTQVEPLMVPGAVGKTVFEAVSSPLVHIKDVRLGPFTIGSEEPPGGSMKFDISGHLDKGKTAEAVHLVGSADRRTYMTLEFRPTGPRVFCQAIFWGAFATGAIPLADYTIWLA
jgi:hypothetical protein